MNDPINRAIDAPAITLLLEVASIEAPKATPPTTAEIASFFRGLLFLTSFSNSYASLSYFKIFYDYSSFLISCKIYSYSSYIGGSASTWYSCT